MSADDFCIPDTSRNVRDALMKGISMPAFLYAFPMYATSNLECLKFFRGDSTLFGVTSCRNRILWRIFAVAILVARIHQPRREVPHTDPKDIVKTSRGKRF